MHPSFNYSAVSSAFLPRFFGVVSSTVSSVGSTSADASPTGSNKELK